MTKEFEIKMADLPNLVDALFVGDQNEWGWVVMNVSNQGRTYINVPDVIAAIETRLPLEITRGANLDEATPDALACLLAVGVMRQGGPFGAGHR